MRRNETGHEDHRLGAQIGAFFLITLPSLALYFAAASASLTIGLLMLIAAGMILAITID